MKVLLLKTSSMGDIIHALPALTDAYTAIPGITFDWVVEEAFAEVPGWHPAVDKIIPIALRRWRKSLVSTVTSGEWGRFKARLKARKYDAVVDAQGLIKSAFLTRLTKGPSHGFDRHSAREPIAARFYQNKHNVSWDQHAVERVRELMARSLNYTLPAHSGRFALEPARFTSDIEVKEPYVVFIHGTTWADKHWPEPYWCHLANQVNDLGYKVLLPWGNTQEKERALRIAKATRNADVLPKMSLSHLAGVLSSAVSVVAVDTGLGHLAAALEKPSISIYGPTSPNKIGSYGKDQIHLTLAGCPSGDFPSVEPALFAAMTPEYVGEALKIILPA